MSCPRINEVYIELSPDFKKVYLRRCCFLKDIAVFNIKDCLTTSLSDLVSKSTSKVDKQQICPLTNSPCNVEFKDNITKIAFNLLRTCNKSSKITYYLYFRFLNESKELNNINTVQLMDVEEPFLYYNRTLEFLKSLKNTNIKSVIITTNATLLNKEKILQLKEISLETNVKYQFTVSIDGCTKETYENSRVCGNFEKVISNAKNIYSIFGKDHLIVSFTAKKHNLYDIPYIKGFFTKNFPGSQQWITKDLLAEKITNKTITYYDYKNRVTINRQADDIILTHDCRLKPRNILPFDVFYNALKHNINNLKNLFNNKAPIEEYLLDRNKAIFESKDKLEKFFNYSLKLEDITDISYIELGTLAGCNLQCYNCCSGDNHQYSVSENDKYYYKLLDLIISSDIHLTDFLIGTSGEIFMEREKLLPYLEKVDGSKIKQISFISNLTLLDKDYIQKLKDISIKNHFNLLLICSIDGISKETYESIRIGANFDKVMHIFADAVNILGQNSIKVNYVRKKPNEQESDNEVKNFFNLYNVHVDILKDVRALEE